jgi:transposase
LDAMYLMTNAERPELNHPKSPCCCPHCSNS